jgi:hypothetical protein
MTTLTLRGLDKTVLASLKRQAALEKISVNARLVRIIEHSLGSRRASPLRRRFDDLDELAGTWSQEDARAFWNAVTPP